MERLQKTQQGIHQVVQNQQVKRQLANAMQKLSSLQAAAQKGSPQEGQIQGTRQPTGLQPSTSKSSSKQSLSQGSSSQNVQMQGAQNDNQNHQSPASSTAQSQGGASRLAFGEATVKNTEQLTPVQIPAAEQVDKVHVIAIGTAFGRPNVSPQRVKTTGTATLARGNAIEGVPIAPQHRKPVQRFFSGD